MAGTGSLLGTEHEVAGTGSPNVPSSPASRSVADLLLEQLMEAVGNRVRYHNK